MTTDRDLKGYNRKYKAGEQSDQDYREARRNAPIDQAQALQLPSANDGLMSVARGARSERAHAVSI